MANLQQKLEQMTADNCLMKEDLAISKNSIISLQAEVDQLSQDKETVTSGLLKHMEVGFVSVSVKTNFMALLYPRTSIQGMQRIVSTVRLIACYIKRLQKSVEGKMF